MDIKQRWQPNKDLSPYLTLHTQVTAEYFFEAESKEDWIDIFKTVNDLKIPLFILGGGSNLAILQNMVKGLVVRNLYQKKALVKENDDEVELLVSSGYSVGRLVKETVDAGYSGFEYHLGLPGTVGGALYMNSKWTKPINYFGDNLIKAIVINKSGEVKDVERDYFHFAYDYSILQETKEFLLEAVFRLKKESPDILRIRSNEALAYRKKTQPFGVSTCGCFFQNISEEDQKKFHLPTRSAGYLIDKAGLKNVRLGDFVVSDKHANFIINTGKGNPEDLKTLLNMIKSKVREKFGVELKEEVIIIN